MPRYFLLTIILLLPACSSEFAYDHMDWLVKWYLDDFVSLNNEQEQEFDGRLNEFLRWHKEDELSFYQSHLTQLKKKLQGQVLDAPQWEQQLIQFRSHWVMLRNQAGLHLVEMAPMLTSDQIAELFENLREQNQERKTEILEKTQAEAKVERFKELIEAVETRIGEPSDVQLKAVDQFVESYEDTSELHNQFSAGLINLGKACFSHANSKTLAECLMPILTEPEQFRSEEYQAKVTRNRQRLATMIAAINSSLSEQQALFFQTYLQEQIEFIVTLQMPD